MDKRPTVLVIDDEPRIWECVARALDPEFRVQPAHSGEEGLRRAEALQPGLILLDLNMPRISGLKVLQRLREQGREEPVVIMTAFGSIASAVQGIKLGATDYIEKPFEPDRLREAVRALLCARAGARTEQPTELGILGKSPALCDAWDLAQRYAPTDLPILLHGETGTGKELFAQAIHRASRRAEGPFVAVDCSALPESLIESEVFGYEKGAFTGADKAKAGQFELAHGGTLFLDEVGNLPPTYQAKLLRVLQSRQYTPLGGTKSRRLDVRFISATNVDLEAAVRDGRFRSDLYFRIGGGVLALPPLRRRTGDVELLAHRFVQRYASHYGKGKITLSRQVLRRLADHPWPGNVRELEHVIERAVVLAAGVLDERHLQLSSPAARADARPEAGGEDEIAVSVTYRCDISGPVDLKKVKDQVAAEAERQVIREVSRRLPLTKGELARFLHVDPKTLRRKCE